MTLRDAYFHLIQVHGEDGPQRPRFRNLHLIDSGEQFIKGSPIWQRDGASATVASNVTNAQTSWFVDAAAGDLHLREVATTAIDNATAHPDVTDDYDGDARPIGAAPDVGADEYGTGVALALAAYLPVVRR